jgi:hypothetical protein
MMNTLKKRPRIVQSFAQSFNPGELEFTAS